MNCGDMGPLLSAYYDGEATADERKFVEDCLESSPEAIAQLREYRRITGEFEALPHPTPPANLRRSVMNQVHTISSAKAALASATTERYRSVERSATGSVRRPVTVATVLGQGLKLGALLAVLVALLIAFTLVFNQFNRNQSSTNIAAGGTQTAVAMLPGTNTPTPQPSSTPVALETSTPALVPGVPTNAPAAPTNTPISGGTVVAQAVPTNTSAMPAPTNTPAPLPPTQLITAPRSTNTTAPVQPANTAAPARATDTAALAASKPSATPTALTAQTTDTPIAPTSTAAQPTATAMQLTATPDLTATPPLSPTPTCAITPVRGFGKLYNEHNEVQNAMGCAIDAEQALTGTILLFQNGTMIWDSQHRLIYVIYPNYNGRTFEVYPENWNQGDGEPTPVVSPPSGLYTPLRGFGKVWFNHQMWETLGFAKQQDETRISEVVENFQGGRMLWTDQNLIYVLSGKLTPSSDTSAVQFSGSWNLYRDTFVDSQPTPTPVASAPDANVTTANPPPEIKKAKQQ